MTRVAAGLHSLNADPPARADDQDFRHGVMLPVRTRLAHVMCSAGSQHRKMGALLRHLINPVLADLLYCGAGVGIALIKISSRFADCCCSIEPVELTKCGYDFITRQEPYCAEVVTTVTIDHALTDHNL